MKWSSCAYIQWFCLQTRQKLDDTKAALEDINARIEQLTSVILDEFYNKMQRAAERLQEQLNQLENHMTHYVDSKIEELARKQANAARDQLAEIYLKVKKSNTTSLVILLSGAWVSSRIFIRQKSMVSHTVLCS